MSDIYNSTEDPNWLFYNETIAIDCDNISPDSVLSKTWFRPVAYPLYLLIFFIALLGNILVTFIVYRIPRMRTVTNYFIVNLAVGDILIDLFCVPTSVISTLILQYWPFGYELCPFINFVQIVAVMVSAHTLVIISIDRYMAILWPLRPRMSRKHAKWAIAGIWTLAIIISSPTLVVSKIHQPSPFYKYCDLYVCQEMWDSHDLRLFYSKTLFGLQFIIPLLIIIFSYSKIGCVVWTGRPPGEAENARDQRMARSKRKMAAMMLIVVFVFTLCWLPYNTLVLIMDMNEEIYQWQPLPYLWASLHWLAMSHACYNPVIYCWLNARFRAGFVNILRQIPFINRFLPDTTVVYNTSMVGIPLTGQDHNHPGLRRTNTCTSYISLRKKANSNHQSVARSASVRVNNIQKTMAKKEFIKLETQPEEPALNV